jgi:hypothetical protein
MAYVGGDPNVDNDGFHAFSTLSPAIQKAEQELAKMHPAFKFPKLGVPDDRRETKMINTPTEAHTMAAVNNNINKQYGDPAETAESMYTAVHGRTTPARDGGAISWAKGDAMRANPKKNPLTPTTSLSTVSHENLHRIFNRVLDQYGQLASTNLATNMFNALPASMRTNLVAFRSSRAPTVNPVLEHEENFAHMLNYLNDKKSRQSFHTQRKDNEMAQQVFAAQMKRAHKHLTRIARNVDPRWITPNYSPQVKQAKPQLNLQELLDD